MLKNLALAAVVLIAATPAASRSTQAAEPATKTLLLLTHQPDGHPKSTHEYVPGQKILKHLLDGTPGLKVELVAADNPWTEGPDVLEKADGVVLFVSQGGAWIKQDDRRFQAFVRLAQRGGGISALHWGTGTKDAKNIDGYVRLLGACHGGPDRKFAEVEKKLDFVAGHPAAAGLEPLTLFDEFYFRLKRAPEAYGKLTTLAKINIKAKGETEAQDEMVAWAFDRADGGRSFGFTGLHFHKNWERPEYRRLVAQGVLWSMKLPVPEKGLDVEIPESLLKLE
jgi:type 1 glutamine amidotransferase